MNLFNVSFFVPFLPSWIRTTQLNPDLLLSACLPLCLPALSCLNIYVWMPCHMPPASTILLDSLHVAASGSLHIKVMDPWPDCTSYITSVFLERFVIKTYDSQSSKWGFNSVTRKGTIRIRIRFHRDRQDSDICIKVMRIHQCCGSGIRCLFDPWIRDPGWVKNQDSDPGWTTRIIIPRAEKQFSGLKYFISLMRIRVLWWKKFGSGMEKIRIKDTG